MPGTMLPSLTTGAIDEIMSGIRVDSPVLQLIQMKRLQTDNHQPARVKLALTDGQTKTIAMSATQVAERFACDGGPADVYSILKLTNYMCQDVKERKVLIVTSFDILAKGSAVGRSLCVEDDPDQPPAGNSRPHHQQGSVANGNNQFHARPAAGAQPSTVARPAAAPALSSSQTHPIASLTPYQNRWCIQARVTAKQEIKRYSNARGEGRLFSVNLADKSGEIRATGFNAECDRFFEMLKKGQVYYVRGGSLKPANKQYSSVNNDYELTFSAETVIEPCYDNAASTLPVHKFSFVPFSDLENRPKDSMIDIIGIVDSVGSIDKVIARTSQKELTKRNIRLIDDTKCAVNLTLWDKDAENFECSAANAHPVVAVKGVKISDFQGVSLSASFGAEVVFNPDCPESHKLRGWYDAHGSSETFQSLTTVGGGSSGGGPSQLMLIAIADADRLGTGEKADFFTVKGVISSLKNANCLYKACPTAECNKKLTDVDDFSYRCEKCQKDFKSFKWRLMLAAQIYDFSGQIWITCFQETAEKILNITAEGLGNLRDNDDDGYQGVFAKAHFGTFLFKLKAKMETYQDESRVKFVCVNVSEPNFVELSRSLMEEIRKMEQLSTVY